MQFALQAFLQDQFYYGADIQNSGALYDPRIAPYIGRDLAESVQQQRGATAFAIYPLNRYSRLEAYSGYIHLKEGYTNDAPCSRVGRLPGGRLRSVVVPQRPHDSAWAVVHQ